MPPRIGISIGDPNGIGPEITLKAIAGLPDLPLIPIGDRTLLSRSARELNLPLPAEIFDPGPAFPDTRPGEISAAAGAASAAWVQAGIQACLQGQLDALVTAPVSKEAWQLAGIGYPGHTELLADACGTSRFGMLLAGAGLRVMLATRHVPLRKVPDALTPDTIRTAAELLVEGLPALGILQPRIAICGLNPHAGDGGAIGDEELTWISPLIRRLAAEGLPVSGPHPADTVFHQAVREQAFDAVIALYHDQGLGPLKLWAFDEGVNLTLGLPIVRTSPDHGTAFGIAGRNLARPHSMTAAIRTAAQLASTPRPASWMPAK